MTLNVIDLREFYLTPLGQCTRALLRQRAEKVWPSVKGETVLGLGYSLPVLASWQGDANRLISFMSSGQGAAYWSGPRGNISALVDFSRLPLQDESVDKCLLLHALEVAPDVDVFLSEVWRVLKPEGKALFFVPHRRGGWASSDRTPFGTGQPYTSRQLRNLLRAQDFVIDVKGGALHLPPGHSFPMVRLLEALEPLGNRFMPAFGGLLVVEVRKQLLAPLFVKNAAPMRHPFFLPTCPLPTG